MTDYFEEKAQQTDISTITAFGITLESRYAKAKELSEMLLFAQGVAHSNLNHLITLVSYDSKATICTIECLPTVKNDSPEGQQIIQIAKKTISQFDLLGTSFNDSYLEDTQDNA